MHTLKPSFIIEAYMPDMEKVIEAAGRTCWKSEDKICEGSAEPFIERLKNVKHESVLEHGYITVRFVMDRGVSHEIVRHRIASFSQESTRYANYGKDKFGSEISVIDPFFFDINEERKPLVLPKINYNSYMARAELRPDMGVEVMMNSFDVWFLTCLWTEWGYMTLLKEFGRTPQEARSVLPNSLKTEIVVSANVREWRKILQLRCDRAAHPQMREIMIPLREEFASRWPVLFTEKEVVC